MLVKKVEAQLTQLTQQLSIKFETDADFSMQTVLSYKKTYELVKQQVQSLKIQQQQQQYQI